MALSYEAERDLINRKRESRNPQNPVYVHFSQEDAQSVVSGFNTLMRHEIGQGRLTAETSITLTPFEQMARSVNIASVTKGGNTASLTQSGVELLGLMVDRYYDEHGLSTNAIPPEKRDVMVGYINFKGVFDRVAQKPRRQRRSLMQVILRQR